MNSFKILKGNKIINKKGSLLKYFNKNSLPKNWKFGEIYVSEISKNMIKGWHWHKYQTSTLLAISGNIKVVIIQNGKFKQFSISKTNLKTIIIKPRTWYAFQGLEKKSNLLNLSDKVHTPNYSKKKDLDYFSYNWKK